MYDPCNNFSYIIHTITCVIYIVSSCDGMFSCTSSPQCVELTKLCDGVSDCTDGSDEQSQSCSPKPSKLLLAIVYTI